LIDAASCGTSFCASRKRRVEGKHVTTEASYERRQSLKCSSRQLFHPLGRPGGSDCATRNKPVPAARTRVPVAGVTSHQQLLVAGVPWAHGPWPVTSVCSAVATRGEESCCPCPPWRLPSAIFRGLFRNHTLLTERPSRLVLGETALCTNTHSYPTPPLCYASDD
jgi:hypothetical protein